MLKHFFVCILFISSLSAGFSQSSSNIDNSVLLTSENSSYLTIHTQGMGFGYRTGYNLTAYNKRVFDFSFVSMRHPKEVKMSNALLYANAKSYVYGKLNYLFILRTSIGTQKILNENPYWGGVEIRRFLSFGPTLGFTKPVYLYISDISGVFPVQKLERYDPEIHFYDNIYGRGPFFKGFDEIKIYPGLQFKAGLNFEHSANEELIRALEIGVSIDAFLKAPPIMSFTDNTQFFLTLYINYHIGGRK